jgi:hypothetical protein
MKKQTLSKISNAVRNTYLRATLAAVLIGGSATATMAQENTKPVTGPVEIKYLGTTDGKPVFQVDFDNASEESVNITIRDQDGTILYVEKFKDRRFSKKFKFDKPEFEQAKLKFTVSGNSGVRSEEFGINSSIRTVQDVVVTKL